MECKRCLFSEPVVTLDENGICNLCHLHDDLEKSSLAFDWQKELTKIKKQKRKYHCLIGISGGLDSSVLLEYALSQGLNPLVIHFDNRWNTKEADANIELLTKNVDFIRYSLNQKEYDTLCRKFLYASVSDADIPNDMAMAEIMFRAAKDYKIKYIFNGHNFRTEGSSPLCWSYMDAKYIKSVWNINTLIGKETELKSFPLLTFWKQLYYIVVCGIKQVRPFYYLNPDMEAEKSRLIEKGWQNYGAKHGENIYTEFIGAYYLPQKFKIDKGITYKSALIRSGKITKEMAYKDWTKSDYDVTKVESILKILGIPQPAFNQIMLDTHRTYKDFETYHSMFKRWKWFFWILMKLKFIPFTFYKKYTA
jgi:hypothetical protein